MRRGFSVSYILIPLAYLVVIVALLFLQFSGASLFKTDVGPFTLTAAFEMGGDRQEKQVSAVSVKFSGLSLSFDNRNSLVLEAQDGRVRNLDLKGYEKLANGFRIEFTEDVHLDLVAPDNSSGQMIMDLQIPEVLVPLRSVKLPYAAADGSEIVAKQNASDLIVKFRNSDWLLALPSRAYVDVKTSMIILPGDSTRKSLRFAEKTKVDKDNLNTFFALPATLISNQEYDAAVNGFIDTAYSAWKGTRYTSTTGTWSFRNAENSFNEEILIDLLSEAWNRNDYVRVYTEMRAAGDINAARLTNRSSLFLGSLKRLTNDMLVQDQNETRRLSEMIKQKNNDILLIPGLVQFATDRGNQSFRAELKAYFEALDPTSLDPRQILGLMQQYYLGPITDPAFEAVLGRFALLIQDSIAPNLIRLDEGIFYLSSENRSDLFYSVLAGKILLRAGLDERKQAYETLGRYMIASALKLADELGYLPADMSFSAGAIVSLGERYRGPEDVYALIQSNPAYPKQVSLFRQAGQGVYFHTIAQVNSMDIRPAEYRINLSYPRKRTHYLYFNNIRNVDPLTGMQLFGIPWRNASDFETYEKGRFYNPETKVLMIKYTDNSVAEDVRIFFNL